MLSLMSRNALEDKVMPKMEIRLFDQMPDNFIPDAAPLVVDIKYDIQCDEYRVVIMAYEPIRTSSPGTKEEAEQVADMVMAYLKGKNVAAVRQADRQIPEAIPEPIELGE